ncbi:MAG: thiamine pyrophosphate-binding protein [Acidimicrobiia bacterium]|nr:thiamine pyrophosphate-binding protein [Acidimicrobiia bacterium]
MERIHGGQLLARALRNEGVDMLFTLTGGHIIGILDGCVTEGIRIVDVRHEQSAAHAAEAYSRLTGKIGVVAVTAGPGVTNTVTGVMNAYYSGTPMLVLGGRHPIAQEHTGGLQEMDHPQLFRSTARFAATVWETARIGEYVAAAVRHAFSGRGGPVFLDIPLDVQTSLVADSTPLPKRYRATEPSGADPTVVLEVVSLLAQAERPVIFAGSGFRHGGAKALVGLAEALEAPSFVNAGARGAFPFGHPLLGNRARLQAFAGADLVLALGVDWDFRTGYGRKINSEATVVQVDTEPTKIGWNRPAHHGVVASPGRFVEQLLAHDELRHDGVRPWTEQLQAAEVEKLSTAQAEADAPSELVGPQFFGRTVADFFGTDSIVAVDGGDIVATTAKWLQVSTPGHVLEPGPAGTLGTGPGFALAAKALFPERRVGIVFGDGGFGFNGMEYDTYVRLGLPVVGVVGNDGVWNNIKSFHRMFYPERVVASDLGRRPYHTMVEALGGHGELVTKPEDLLPALERAEASKLPALVNVHIDETFRASSNYSG